MINLVKANKAIKLLLDEVKDFVKENGGFINTDNVDGENDQMYAYVYFWNEDEVEELKVIAIKVEDNILYIAMSTKSASVEVNSIEDFTEDDWYSVGMSGDVLLEQTIFSIAESIEQYV